MLQDFYLNMLLKIKAFLTNKSEVLFLLLVLLFSVFLRFYKLGYSSYYGDETKTLYLDKTVPAMNFLLDQRKGPVQFAAAWVMEKISGGYGELYIRLPFALAGTLSILVFYLLAKKLLGKNAALVSTFIYSTSGFNVAFSRTAQYQSFLVLFGLLSIYLFITALQKHSGKHFLLASVSLTLALLSHYDAVFFLVPIIYLFLIQKDKEVKTILIFFVIPAFVLLSVFYVPYIARGYMSSNTVSYVAKRFSGESYEVNNSLYTLLVYNPLYVQLILLGGAFIYLVFIRSRGKVRTLFLLWFFSTLFFYQLLVSNPGTHIHNYLLPLYMLTGALFVELHQRCKKVALRILLIFVAIAAVVFSAIISLYTYIPGINNGYPWKEQKFLFISVPAIDKANNHLYLYGFPYERNWREIKDLFSELKGVRGYHTNDSAVSSKYYLQKLDLTPPGPNFLPQYFIDVENNMEFKMADRDFLGNYVLVKEFYENGNLTSSVYRLLK